MGRFESVLLVALSLIALLTLGAQLQHELGLVGLVAAEALTVALPAIAWARWRRVPLGAGAPAWQAVVGGALVGFAAFYVMAMIEQYAIEPVLPTPPGLRAMIERLIRGGSLPLDLLALALAPALAEEALFRGAVLGAWRGRTGAVVSAVLFGAYHTSVYRMLPATLLGLALGWVRLAGDSLWAAVAFHAVNNAAVVVMARQGLETLPSPAQAPLLALSAAASLAGGLALLRQTNRRTQRP